MAEPSKKSEEFEVSLARLTGVDRRISIRNDVCVPKPIGCGGPATEFRDELSAKEFTISGLCQRCQDEVFGKSEL